MSDSRDTASERPDRRQGRGGGGRLCRFAALAAITVGRTVGMVLGAVVLGLSLLGATEAAHAAQTLAYTSSIQIKDRDGGGDNAKVATLAQIDACRATTAALAMVRGTALRVTLDNENGSVEVSRRPATASRT